MNIRIHYLTFLNANHKTQNFVLSLEPADVMQGSILPVTIPPPGHTPGDLQFFSYLAVYSPPLGTQKETIPNPRDSSSTKIDFRTIAQPATRRFDKNLNSFLEFPERRILHSIKKHGHYIEEEN